MYVYIYDDFLEKGRFNKAINRVEIRLTDLGLNGKIIRLAGIKNIKTVIQNEIKLGARTIIAVGNNQTVNKIIGTIIDTDVYEAFQKKTLLGIIPIGDDNSIAESFGIKDEKEACNILLARRVEKIDLGIAGDYYFLNKATISSQGTEIKINDYTISTPEKGEISIVNLMSSSDDWKSNPHDGLLDVYIRTKRKDASYLNAKRIRISNADENHKLLIDNVLEIDTPVDLGIMKNYINVIVGKDRLFE
jgi:hypothetical protein